MGQLHQVIAQTHTDWTATPSPEATRCDPQHSAQPFDRNLFQVFFDEGKSHLFRAASKNQHSDQQQADAEVVHSSVQCALLLLNLLLCIFDTTVLLDGSCFSSRTRNQTVASPKLSPRTLQRFLGEVKSNFSHLGVGLDSALGDARADFAKFRMLLHLLPWPNGSAGIF
jgi:hypothetical protein